MRIKQLAVILLTLCFLLTAVPVYAAQFSYSDLNEYRHIIQNEVLNNYKGRVFFAVDVDAQAVRVYAEPAERDSIAAALKRYGINMDMVIIEGRPAEISPAIATANANIRSGPGISYKKLGTLNKGQSVSVIRITNKWAQFIWNDTVAYVHSDYIKYGNTVIINSAGNPVVATVNPDASGTFIAIATGNVNIRSGPGTNYKKLGKLRRGQTVAVSNVKGKWAEITWTGSKKGYVHTDYLKFETVSNEPTIDIPSTDPGSVGAAIATGNVNVRSGPNTNYKKLGKLRRGQTVAVWSITGKWAEITWTGNQKGYVHTDYLRMDAE